MYLRPGNLIKDFIIEPLKRVQNSKGRAQTTYDTETRAVLRGVIADASTDAAERYSQAEHPCTHQIAQRGGAKAKTGDRLARDHSHYYILGVDDIGALSVATIYYVEERADLDDGSRL